MFHAIPSAEVLSLLGSDEKTGLTTVEAQKRLAKYGKNTLPEAKKKHWFWMFLGYFKDFLLLILFVAALISFAVGEVKDAVVILLIIIGNALMGFLQEAKADHAIAALKKLSVVRAKVIREEKAVIIDAKDLVPGDIILLEQGDRVPADARLLEATQLKISESALTGESKAVEKKTEVLPKEKIPLGDRINLLFKDTVVIFGRGRAIVTSTGAATEIGQISELLQQQGEKTTALKLELERLGKRLTIFAGVTAVLIFIALLTSRTPHLRTAFLTAVSMAIAVVPEGIPAVVTTVLAISVARLARHRAIVRKLEVVETLGAATCILTDKTGTLTKNEMIVSDLILPTTALQFINGILEQAGMPFPIRENEDLRKLLFCAILCNDAQLSHGQEVVGDPTEACLLKLALALEYDVEKIRAEYPRVFEIPFSSETKRMTVVVKNPSGTYGVFTKGAGEVLQSFLAQAHPTLLESSGRLAANGIRNLAYTYKELPTTANVEEGEQLLLSEQQYLGIIGCKDPLRPEVMQAVGLARAAGVRTVMITGDHKLIARNIAMELRIVTKDEQIIDGAELEQIPEAELAKTLQTVQAFSRVSPQQKLQIVVATMTQGETVIVTGDGVNDAPAIKTADIGVAMGIAGTDVAKEAADLVLQDDNYATIVEAIKQGRGIFGNFVKFLTYQISCNLSGVFIVFPLTLLDLGIPLLPIHILLLNLISETGPCIALGLEKPEETIMKRKPRPKHERLLTKARWIRMICEAVLLALVGIAAFFLGYEQSLPLATTMVLVTAFLSRLWHALNARSETLSIFSKHLRRNSALTYTVLGTLLFLFLAIYTSLGNSLIKTVPLEPTLLFACLFLSGISVVLIEVYKIILRRSREVPHEPLA